MYSDKILFASLFFILWYYFGTKVRGYEDNYLFFAVFFREYCIAIILKIIPINNPIDAKNICIFDWYLNVIKVVNPMKMTTYQYAFDSFFMFDSFFRIDEQLASSQNK